MLFVLFSILFVTPIHALWGNGEVHPARTSPFEKSSSTTLPHGRKNGYASLDDNRFDKVFQHAAWALQSLTSADGICSRVVVSGLLDNCDALDLSRQNYNQEIEDIRTQFAALLALCELKYNETNWPRECRSITSSERVTSVYLTQCFHWLQADGKRWTSYSNSREMSHVVCKGSRELIERERTVRIQAESIAAAGNVGKALKQLVADYELKLKGAMEFSETVQKLRQETLQDLETLNKEARDWMKSLHHNLKARALEPMNAITDSIGLAADRVKHLHQEIDHVSQVSTNIRADFVETQEYYAMKQHESFSFLQSHLETFQHSLQQIADKNLSTLAHTMNSLLSQTAQNYEYLHGQVQQIHTKIIETQQSQEEMISGLEKFKVLVLQIRSVLQIIATFISYAQHTISYLWSMRAFEAVVAVSTISSLCMIGRRGRIGAAWTLLVIASTWSVQQCTTAVLEDIGWISGSNEPSQSDSLLESLCWLLGSVLSLASLVLLRVGPRYQWFERHGYFATGKNCPLSSKPHFLESAPLSSPKENENTLSPLVTSEQLRVHHNFLLKGSPDGPGNGDRFRRGYSAPPEF